MKVYIVVVADTNVAVTTDIQAARDFAKMLEKGKYLTSVEEHEVQQGQIDKPHYGKEVYA